MSKCGRKATWERTQNKIGFFAMNFDLSIAKF